LWIDIDQTSSVPIYIQLIDNIKLSIAQGILMPGEKLPSIRELAGKISINPNTIAKAYQELEKNNVITTLKGKGTFVCDNAENVNFEQENELIKPLIEKVLVEAFYLNYKEEDLKTICLKIIDEWYKKRGMTNE
jgi:GntR family transcriptional regulator